MINKIYLLISVCMSLFFTNDVKAQTGEEFLGEIRMFAGNFAPRNWAECNGQLLPINQLQALYSIIGTTYGGDGITTFALPDLRGRAPIHAGNGPGLTSRPQGSTGGTENIYLTVQNLPAHNHLITANASTDVGTTNIPTANYPANTSVLDKEYATSSNTTMGISTTGNTGNYTPFSNAQPYGVVRYIICLQGVFPSQN
jgi:microcystin-dependent protein